jgi:hypothetical protein
MVDVCNSSTELDRPVGPVVACILSFVGHLFTQAIQKAWALRFLKQRTQVVRMFPAPLSSPSHYFVSYFIIIFSSISFFISLSYFASPFSFLTLHSIILFFFLVPISDKSSIIIATAERGSVILTSKKRTLSDCPKPLYSDLETRVL